MNNWQTYRNGNPGVSYFGGPELVTKRRNLSHTDRQPAPQR